MNPADEKRNCGRCLKSARMAEAEYCGSCLVEVIEKRVGKRLNPINGGSGKPGSGRILIACESESSLSCAAAAYLAKKLCKPSRVSVIKPASQRSRMRQPNNPVIIPRCADETAACFLGKVISGSISGSRNTSASDTAGAVNVFESVTEKGLELYAAIKRIKYRKSKNSKYSYLKQKIQKLQARYPGTIEALAQASRQTEEILHKPA